MEKLKSLPVTMILLLDNLKSEVEEISTAQTAEARLAACERAKTSIEFMSGLSSEAAAEIERLT